MDYDLLSLLAGIAIPTIGGIIATGKLIQLVRANAKDLERAMERIENLEKTRPTTDQIRSMVDGMKELVEEKFRGVAEILRIHSVNNERQMGDLKEDIQTIRQDIRKSN